MRHEFILLWFSFILFVNNFNHFRNVCFISCNADKSRESSWVDSLNPRKRYSSFYDGGMGIQSSLESYNRNMAMGFQELDLLSE